MFNSSSVQLMENTTVILACGLYHYFITKCHWFWFFFFVCYVLFCFVLNGNMVRRKEPLKYVNRVSNTYRLFCIFDYKENANETVSDHSECMCRK